MTPTLRPMLLAAGLAAVAFALPVAAETAQRTPTAASQPGAGGAAVREFTEEELKSFAEASLQVEEIGSKWNPKISEADDKADEAGLREQAMDEMVSAVPEKGLDRKSTRLNSSH